jgi:uncharacterized protein (TIGR03083 family)
MDMGAIYRDTRLRVTDLLRALSPEQLVRPLPACPRWTARDIAAHVTGNVANGLAGKLEGLGTDPWTAAQVQERRDRTLDEVLAEWSEIGPEMEAHLTREPRMGYRLLTDLATHEQDVRGGLSIPGGRDSAGLRTGLEVYIRALDQRVRRAALPALELRADGSRWIVGEGESGAVVSASEFELFRALSGRRSARQIAALAWHDSGERYLEVFSHFPIASQDIVELDTAP